MNTTNIILIAFLVIGIVIALYFAYTKIMSREKFSEQTVRICLIYAKWCPHCERYLESGVFDKVALNMSNRSSIKFEKVDYDQNKNMATKYGVSSFPSIIAIDANEKKISEFKGDRNDTDALERFALEAAGSV